MASAYRNSAQDGRRWGRLGGSTFDVRPSGVDTIQEGEYPLPHRLRGRKIVLGQVRVSKEVARAGVGVRLEGGPRSPDGLPERGHLPFGLHPGVRGGVVNLDGHPFGPSLDAEVLAEILHGD